jgi:two-component system CheB/CheR fusion protein
MSTETSYSGLDPNTWLAGQKAAFQAAMNGASLAISLDILIDTAIRQSDGERRCAFYIADNAGGLHHVVGMPLSYAERVDGFKIDPAGLACGLAVSTGNPVITPDVFREPRWTPWLQLAIDYDYRGCWSFPVETAAGKVVGSFAMYFREPHSPTEHDRRLAAALCDTAAIIICYHQESGERERLNEQLQRLTGSLSGKDGGTSH